MRTDYELIESTQRQNHEILRHEEEMILLGERRALMLFSELKPRLFLDGDMWCCLLGEDIQEGVAGFGKSRMAAITAFASEF